MLIQPQNREQTTLYTSLEDLISVDNPVRVIDVIINAIVRKSPESYTYKGQSHQGRPAYPVPEMLKLFIYGCINRINSSRRLETESKRNIELMWLLGNLSPDFKTIADFRKDNKEIIRQCSKEVKTFLKLNGLVNGKLISIDGTKLKANANRSMLEKDTIINRIYDLESDIENYIKQLDSLDEQESEEASARERMQQAYEQNILTLQNEINVLRSVLHKLQTDNKNYISITDIDCSKQRSLDGIIPGYNVQIACDTKHGFIIAEDVTVESNDINQLKPMLEEVRNELGINPETAIADTGYCNLEDLQKIEANGTNCYVPPQKEQIKNPEITFTYQKDKDRYICSEGKYLTLAHKNKRYKNSHINVYIGESCQICPLVDKCTKSKKGRHISRYWNQNFRDQHREKMRTELAKSMSKIRKSTIEPIFGTAKVWLGKIPLQTRGKPNVKTEIKIFSISFNINKLMNLFSFKEIMAMIYRYLGFDSQRTLNFIINSLLIVLLSLNKAIKTFLNILQKFLKKTLINPSFVVLSYQ